MVSPRVLPGVQPRVVRMRWPKREVEFDQAVLRGSCEILVRLVEHQLGLPASEALVGELTCGGLQDPSQDNL